MESTILVVEDERRSAEWICTYLERENYRTLIAYDGKDGLEIARNEKPDLIVLDVMLPGMSGTEVCRTLREESEVPIVMLTARGGRDDKLMGFGQGADDYIVKPFDPDELVVRIKALLRRSRSANHRSAVCGPLMLDIDSEEATLDGRPLELSHAQFAILSVLIGHPGIILTRNQIIHHAFDDNYDAFDRAIDTHIRRIRKIIHREGFEPIKTVYGAGYKLVCPS